MINYKDLQLIETFVNTWMKSGKEPTDHASPVMTNQSEPKLTNE